MKEETSNKVNSEGASASKNNKKPISTFEGGLGHLSSFPYSRHKMKRLGRGKSSGHGGTSTKGHKGQRSRSGFGLLRGFEGGQMPLVRRLPKFGFTNNRFKVKYDIVNLSDLNRFDSEVDPTLLYQSGLVGKQALVKILAKDSLNKPLKIKAHYFSQKAIELIKKAGGTADKINIASAMPAADTQETKTSPKLSKKEELQADKAESTKEDIPSSTENNTSDVNGNTKK